MKLTLAQIEMLLVESPSFRRHAAVLLTEMSPANKTPEESPEEIVKGKLRAIITRNYYRGNKLQIIKSFRDLTADLSASERKTFPSQIDCRGYAQPVPSEGNFGLAYSKAWVENNIPD